MVGNKEREVRRRRKMDAKKFSSTISLTLCSRTEHQDSIKRREYEEREENRKKEKRI